VAKTKTRTSGRVSNRFWKLLERQHHKDQITFQRPMEMRKT